MTDDDLDRAEQLAAAATPGPWCAYFSAHGDPYVLGRPVDRGGREPLFPQDTVAAVATSPDDYGRADAEFIAAARDLVPSLIARLQTLTAAGNALAAAADPLLGDDVGHFWSAWEIDTHHGLDGEKLADSLRTAREAWRALTES